MTLLLDILDIILVFVTLYSSYKIVIARKDGKQFSELKNLTILFVSCIILLWLVQIYNGFLA